MRVIPAVLVCALAAITIMEGCSNEPQGREVNDMPAAPVAQTAPAADNVSNVSPFMFSQEEVMIPVALNSPDYKRFLEISKPGPIVPGLNQGLIPQGLSYYKEKNWMLISSYRKDGNPSVISIIDVSSGKQIKSLELYQDEKTPYTGHAATVTVSLKHVWITSESSVYQMKLEDLISLPDGGPILFEKTIQMENSAVVSAYSDGVLWVGEFGRAKTHETKESHKMAARDGKLHMAWVVGYKLTPEDTIDEKDKLESTAIPAPQYLLSIPDEIQGMAIADDEVYVSASYGLAAASRLSAYKLSLNEAPHAMAEGLGPKPVPIWFLDSLNEMSTLKMPPMSEGVMVKDNLLYIVFEAAAKAYRAAPLDKVYSLERKYLLKDV